MSRLRRWFSNIPVSDPVERRQAGVFQWVLVSWILLVTLQMIFTYLPFLFLPQATTLPPAMGPIPPIIWFAFALSGLAGLLLWLCPIVALVFLRRGKFRFSVSVATIGLLATHTIATYVLGVSSAIVLIMFQVPIVLAGLLGGRRLLLSIAGMSVVIVTVVGLLQSATPPLAGFFGVIPNPDGTFTSPFALTPLGSLLGFFIGVTALVTLLLERFGGVFRDALASALEREEELQGIRASLETSVTERTAALQAALTEVEARAKAQAQMLAEIEQQRSTIRDISVPIIPVSADTLVMPLVGMMDNYRLLDLQERSLQALEQMSARRLVLDITGVPVVDSTVAQGLLLTVRSARLLGATVVLVGVRPKVAQTIVGLGIELRDLPTFRDLQSALASSAAKDMRSSFSPGALQSSREPAW